MTASSKNFWGSTKAIQELSDTICVEHGKSIIENPKRTTKRHDRWEADNGKLPHQEIVQRLLNEILDSKPKDLNTLIEYFRRKGFEVRVRGNSVSIKADAWKRFVRLDSLGKCYTKDRFRKHNGREYEQSTFCYPLKTIQRILSKFFPISLQFLSGKAV